MADRYVNTATGNDTTGDGSSGNPYATLQKAWDMSSHDDTIYGCGTDTGGINWGTTTKRRLSIIGCDSSWNIGGAQLVIDGQNSLTNLLWSGTTNSVGQYGRARFCTFKRATGSVIGGADYTFDNWLWDRCIFENCGSDAFPSNPDLYRRNYFWRCLFRNNSGAAIYRSGVFTCCVLCRFSGNTGGGIYSTYAAYDVLVHCLFDGNGDRIWGSGRGANEYANPMLIFGCAADGNTHGVEVYGIYGNGPLIVNNRFTHTTNRALEVQSSDRRATVGSNYFHGNDTDLYLSSLFQEIEDSLYDQENDGYVDQPNDDFNLDEDALMRSVELPLDWDV